MHKAIKTHSSRVVLAALLGLCASGILGGCWSPPPEANIDEFIEYTMDFGKLPGFAAVIVKNGEVVWAKGYGWANIEEGIAVTPDTLFFTASIAKTVVGTAVMQLYEQGLIGLDANVNDYLPFSVRNPNHPDTPITTRMLLTHTSSITDPGDLAEFWYQLDEEGADSPITLREFLEGYLLPGGQWYRQTENFSEGVPGTQAVYSNAAATLAAYLVEVRSGVPFDQYCKENIFQPLGMNETSYRLSDLDVSHIAVRYEYDAGRNSYKPLPHVGHPAYPVGSIRTSVNEFARFLAAFMNGGELDGVRILKAETVEEMLTPLEVELGPEMSMLGVEGPALSWMYIERGGELVPSHSGGAPGVVTNTFFLRDGSLGVAWFTNSHALFTNSGPDLFVLLARPDVHLDERLLEEAKKY